MNATVIIPAYDPEDNLIQIVNRVRELGNRVIVIDDGSDLNKHNLFKKLRENAIVIHHDINLGKGAAIKTALTYIKKHMWDCDVIGVMDADGQHLPEDMEKLIMKVDQRRRSMILGVRSIGKEMPLRSRMGNSITRGVFNLLSGVKVSDTQTGLRAFPRRMIDKFLKVNGTRYEYETNVLFYCAKEKIPIEEVPIKTIYHDEENSCSHFNPIKDSFRIYKDIIKFTLSSLSSFFVDYLAFCLFTVIFPSGAMPLLIANILARIISGGYNYYMNCKVVFHSKAKTQTAMEYLLLALVIIILNSFVLQFYNGICGIPVYAAKILTELTLFAVSYAVQRLFIFNKSRKEGNG